MREDIQAIVKRHKAFWELIETERPIVGYSVGGLSQFQQFQSGVADLSQGLLMPEMLKPEAFLKDYERILEYNDIIQDDLICSVEPFPAVPWMEAMIGCPVYNSGKNIWSEPLSTSLEELEEIQYKNDSPWVKKYMEFITFLTEKFGNRCSIGQAIMRGPADMLSAVLGETKFLYALYDNPEVILRLVQRFTEIHNEFLKAQISVFPKFQGGYVIGQYHIWAPGKCSRLQEDASSLLSPDLYKKFFFEMDREMARVAEFNLIHLHTSSLFLLELFLAIDELKTLEITLDTGGPSLRVIIESLKKIQKAGKRLVIKGALDEETIRIAEDELSVKGLCLQAVVDNLDEMELVQDIFARYWE